MASCLVLKSFEDSSQCQHDLENPLCRENAAVFSAKLNIHSLNFLFHLEVSVQLVFLDPTFARASILAMLGYI